MIKHPQIEFWAPTFKWWRGPPCAEQQQTLSKSFQPTSPQGVGSYFDDEEGELWRTLELMDVFSNNILMVLGGYTWCVNGWMDVEVFLLNFRFQHPQRSCHSTPPATFEELWTVISTADVPWCALKQKVFLRKWLNWFQLIYVYLSV